MGVGKTASTLLALDILQLAGSGFFPALVIAPKRVAQLVWTGERDKWDCFHGLRMIKVLGDPKERLNALDRKADIYVINYDNIQWLVDQFKGKPWPFKIVIADESTRLKNFRLNQGGARATALSMVAQHTGRWINLTGTPVTNGLTDLWGQTWFLDFGKSLGRTYTQFLNRWFIEEAYTHRKIILPNAESEIYEAISDITLALRTEDCIPNIRKPFWVNVEIELPKRARSLYDQMEADFFIQLGGDTDIEAFNAAAKSMKLLEMACGSVYDEEGNAHEIHSEKLEALHDIVEENGENLLVAYHFKFDALRIKKEFPKARFLKTERDIDDWNDGKIKMLLLHPASAGHGLNLQGGGRSIVFFSHTWDLELRQQVIERIGVARQIQAGYDRAVLGYNIVAKDTIEEACLARTDAKLTVQQALMLAQSRR